MSSRESTPKVNKRSTLSLRRKRIASENTTRHSPEIQLEKSVSDGFVENTPKNTITLTPQTQSAPPNFRPYRLSLNKHLRETMTKKRLEFHMALEKEKFVQVSDPEEVADTEVCDENYTQLSDQEEIPETENVNCSDEEQVPDTEEIKENVAEFLENVEVLETEEFRIEKEDVTKKQGRRKMLKKLEIVEEEMQAQQKHIARTKDLQSEISRWRHGFNTKVNDLKTSIEPFNHKLSAMNKNGIQSFYESD